MAPVGVKVVHNQPDDYRTEDESGAPADETAEDPVLTAEAGKEA